LLKRHDDASTGAGLPQLGTGVVDALHEGYKQINPKVFDYVCKLELELDLGPPPRYFERLIEGMESAPRTGRCRGKLSGDINATLVGEQRGDEVSVERAEHCCMSCLKQAGGLGYELMWDAIDCHHYRQAGGLTRGQDEPELRFGHLHLLGSSQQGTDVGRKHHGFGQYLRDTGIAHVAASSVFWRAHRPSILGWLATFWGYLDLMPSCTRQLPNTQRRKSTRGPSWRCSYRGRALRQRRPMRSTLRCGTPEASRYPCQRRGIEMFTINRFENCYV